MKDIKQYNLRRLEQDEAYHDETAEFSLDVLAGLSRSPKEISSKYFYDDEGSRLFQEITRMPEYYLTRCEFEILENKSGRVSTLVAEALNSHDDLNVIELGAGDGHKTFLLIDQLLKENIDFEYTPIDISVKALEFLIEKFSQRFPGVRAEALVSEYFHGMNYINNNHSAARNLVLFLGSNIGNFSRAQAEDFMVRLWHVLNHGDLVLIGFDLKKDIELLTAAYSDPGGVTRDFNLNLLTRMNRELGADFEIEQFYHHAFYNPSISAMESYLVSKKPQQVFFKAFNSNISFRKLEAIHTEFSYKYGLDDIDDLAASTGFTVLANLFDERQFFVDSVWQVQKEARQVEL